MDFLARFHEISLECGKQLPALETWRAALGDNSVLWPIERGGQMVGGVLFYGQTVHIVIEPKWQGRWITPKLCRAYETWTHPGEVWADIPIDNHLAQRFAKRAGFKFQKALSATLNRYVKEPIHADALF